MALHPQATNTVECSSCGWKRIVDPLREYRGGHTHPTNLTECHSMLTYTEASPTPPEIYMLDEAEAFPGADHPDRTQAQTDALETLYQLEDGDVDTALATAAGS